MKPTNTDTQEVERQIEGQSAEQAADLAALQAMAGPVPGQEEGAAASEAAAVMGLEDEIEGLLTVGVSTLGVIFPSVPENCPQEAVKALAGVWAAVGEKWGWQGGLLAGKYAAEISAFAVTAPIGFAIYKGIQGDIAARQPAEPSRTGELNLSAPVPTAPAPGKGVTFGAPIPVAEAANA